MPGRLFSAVVIGFTAFELLTFSHGFVGFSASSSIYPSAPLFDFIRKNADPAQFRVIQSGNAYSSNVAMIYGFAAADGYEVALQRPRLFAGDLSEDREDGVFFTADKILAAHDRRLDLLNIKYVVVPSESEEFRKFSAALDRFSPAFTDGHVSVFENKRVLPRAFLVPASGVEVVPDAQGEISTLRSPGFDPERHVLLTEQPFSSDLPAAGEDGGDVVQNISPNEYHVQVRSSAQSVLLLSQIFYPGWQATLDGAATQIFPANYALTGVAIPPGNHDVHLFFDPASFKIGIAITGLAFITMMILCARRGLSDWRNP